MVKVLIGFALGLASVGACVWCYKKGYVDGVKKCNDIMKNCFKDIPVVKSQDDAKNE